MQPTRIYVKPILELLKDHPVHALSHITGGGFWENLPRVLPEHLAMHLDTKRWQRPAVFDWLQEKGNITDVEMLRTFNCGIGMVLVVPASAETQVIQRLTALGEQPVSIGIIETRENEPVIIDGIRAE